MRQMDIGQCVGHAKFECSLMVITVTLLLKCRTLVHVTLYLTF